MIEPPEGLPWSPESRNAWLRITANLEKSDEWEPLYQSMTFVAATQCAQYLQCARLHGVQAKVTQECHQLTRLLLADMHYLEHAVVDQLWLDDLGRDTDLVQICMPLEEA